MRLALISTTGPYRRISKRLDPARPREQRLRRDASNHRRGPGNGRASISGNQKENHLTDSQPDGRTLAARYLKGLNDHDPDAVDGFVAVDYINHNAFVADGREANRAWWSTFFTAFPDIKATMDDLVVAGDRVVGRFTYRGTHGGPLYGVPPTGNPIEMRSIDIWRTENGEFVEHWDELNYLELFQQIGVIPAIDFGDA